MAEEGVAPSAEPAEENAEPPAQASTEAAPDAVVGQDAPAEEAPAAEAPAATETAEGAQAEGGAQPAAAAQPAASAPAEGEKIVSRKVKAGDLLRRSSRSILDDIKKKRRSITIESMVTVDDADAKLSAEEAKWKMPADFFYSEDDPQLLPQLGDGELPRQGVKPARFAGFDFTRYYNLVWTAEREFAYITGQVVVFQNLDDPAKKRFLPGRDNGGIGGLSMSPDGKFLAVAEKSTTGAPNIYIYEYATFKLYRILRKGTTKGYAAVAFSPHQKGARLAALGMAPDYLLSVWDWRNERLLLKCKAYGQDVFNVKWGQFPGMLTTMGTGHIRFWKMATTFTGLKLQGDLGKFGATELSDIAGSVELPDGKVVTGSEYGRLLLWEGVFVKVELMCGEAENPLKISKLPHEGPINTILLDTESKCVVSGGADGYLRWWPIDEIDVAEADYDNGILEYGIGMRKEVRVPPPGGKYSPALITHIARSRDDATWLIQDARNGVTWVYDKDSGEAKVEVSSHAGPITGASILSQFAGLVLSSGSDGSVRALNMCSKSPSDMVVFKEPSRLNAGVTSMAMAPAIVDPELRTLCCAYADGTVRIFAACRDGLVLIQASKPHTCKVEQVAYSPDGQLFYSRASDNTIFFFEVRNSDEHLVPMGFVKLHCRVNYSTWHLAGRLLLSLEDGTLMELSQPVYDVIDNSETFQIMLDYRPIAPEVPEPESEEEDEENEEGDGEVGDEQGDAEPKETKEERRERRKKEKEAAKEAAKKEAEDEGEANEAVVSEILRAVYLPKEWVGEEQEDLVLFVGTGMYAGALWSVSMSDAPVIRCEELAFGEHVPPNYMSTLRTKIPTSPVTFMEISPRSRFLFLGFQDGGIRIIPFVNMNAYSILDVVDSCSGGINSVGCDDAEYQLVVGGGDGTLTSVMINADGIIEAAELKGKDEEAYAASTIGKDLQESMPESQTEEADNWDLPLCDSSGVMEGRDILDPQAYSIQDAKLKAEEDNAKAAAEQRKKRVREKIGEVRRELEELQAKNSSLPCNTLSASEMTIDVEFIDHVTKDMEVQIEEVNRELAWDIEFHEKGLQKLKDYYLGRLDFERIEVFAFRAPHRVATFRCPSMSPELRGNLAKLHELIFAADRPEDDDVDDENGDAAIDVAGGIADGFRETHGGKSFGDTARTGRDGVEDEEGEERHISGAEMREIRRQQRQERKQYMVELEKSKPSDTYEDPRDLEAIANAEATLGNFMLKTSDSYQVPENQRMNAEKKRRQMFLLEESSHAIRTEFNHRVLALRDFRQQVKQEVKRDLVALQEIDQQLGTTTDWVNGLLDDPPNAPTEFPERRFDITDSELKAYISEVTGVAVDASEAREDEEDEEAYDEDDYEDLDEEDDNGEEGDDDEAGRGKARRKSKRRTTGTKGKFASALAATSGRSALASRRISRLALRAGMLQTSTTGLSKAVFDEARARLWHDKAQLEDHIRQVVDTFNSAVASIAKEKAKLESDLKNADLKLLVLFDELLTLNELEAKDEALLQKATKCRQDKAQIMNQIKECQDQLGEKKTEIEQWHTEEQSLQAEFTELVGETSPFLGALLKIYKKKVKRKNLKKGGDMGDDDDEDEDEDEEDDDEDEDDEDEDDEEEVGPPQGCDVQIYESVIDLREKRLDMEEALQEIQRAVEELKRTHKKLLDDERKINKDQTATDAEIQQFQTDKQRKLNQIPIVFALRLSQVQCLDPPPGEEDELPSNCLPANLDEYVVFTNEGLQRLMSRITELRQEIRDVRAHHLQLKRDFRTRKKEKNHAIAHIGDLQAKFEDIQMLKFGQIVDLELIERNAPSKYVQELQEKVAEAEIEQRKRLAAWEKRLERQKKDVMKITTENTSLMDQIVSMGYSQMQLDAALNARIANVTVNDTEPLTECREMEREKLKDLLALQNKEIVTLQAEINLFRKKGGHIYTTVTANRS
eukprot:TRINITY_DN7056_c0_g1_i4.p1 TRINITY_DN7056_c0_g1~~TRINITY_DN7056_c0_g1_i4.p1  ORF type:complete len:1976 (-),score=403.36 TRINITY_DN7056_c0_g1_i4:144-5993(-)